MMKIHVPFPIVAAQYELSALLGEEQSNLGFPRRLELKEPDGGPAVGTEQGFRWRQVIDSWSPGVYIRHYCFGYVDHHFGNGLELIGARLRFMDRAPAVVAWTTLTEQWEKRRARLIAEFGSDATGRFARPIKGALLRSRPSSETWKESGAEIWIVGQKLTDGSAPIPDVWVGKLPDEIVRLTEVPHGTCINEVE